ncbi:hypothetical protein HMPREF3196_00400 [Bifidobacterium bifidum]|uniref:Uncharacterized protein n=1 Tax=Bifidobacterium bifidum TaxID=1681 RepID=A0A133KRZ5_BIFBI|nr:hypothetical protein HMPREF3196_00400 [Bifidobacterium bifidum]
MRNSYFPTISAIYRHAACSCRQQNMRRVVHINSVNCSVL